MASYSCVLCVYVCVGGGKSAVCKFYSCVRPLHAVHVLSKFELTNTFCTGYRSFFCRRRCPPVPLWHLITHPLTSNIKHAYHRCDTGHRLYYTVYCVRALCLFTTPPCLPFLCAAPLLSPLRLECIMMPISFRLGLLSRGVKLDGSASRTRAPPVT